MKDQFRLLKNSNSEQNVCESAENTEKLTFDNWNSKSTLSEEFTTVNGKLWQKKSHPRGKKSDLNCSNRYETLYITDSTTESESEDPNYITYTGTWTDNNTRSGYTCRLYQQNDDLKQVNKTKWNYGKCK